MVEVQHLYFISRNPAIFMNFNYSMSSKKNLIIYFQQHDTDVFQHHFIFDILLYQHPLKTYMLSC